MNAQQMGTDGEDGFFRTPSFTLFPKETLAVLAVDFEREFGRLAPVIFVDDPDIIEVE